MEKEKQEVLEKVRVSTMLYRVEKEWLQLLAERSGRSMSGYLRYLLNEDIEVNSD
jgi:hypothetical protein